jgi:hypothetical protein
VSEGVVATGFFREDFDSAADPVERWSISAVDVGDQNSAVNDPERFQFTERFEQTVSLISRNNLQCSTGRTESKGARRFCARTR